ncbi:MAG: hypothetical protein H6978_09675 [Gammaproteobacteria bacterium]|nr:hypothetical protein [Gammaproteobacteria bacterium]
MELVPDRDHIKIMLLASRATLNTCIRNTLLESVMATLPATAGHSCLRSQNNTMIGPLFNALLARAFWSSVVARKVGPENVNYSLFILLQESRKSRDASATILKG